MPGSEKWKLSLLGGGEGMGSVSCEGDLLSCRLGLTLRKPLAAREELLTSPFLRPSVTLLERHESKSEECESFPVFILKHTFDRMKGGLTFRHKIQKRSLSPGEQGVGEQCP